MPAKRLISIVSPCYNEERSVNECYLAVKRVFDESLSGYEWEHVFSDNCSTDDTVAVLREIAARDPHVKVIVNSRNYGAFRSMFNALMKTRGDAVLAMLAVDLQDPPALLVDFVARWEEGYKVVFGIRKNRKESFLMRSARSLFYRLVQFSANINIPTDAGEFQLLDRQVVEALRHFKDYFPYLRGMIANVGFKSVGIPYDWGVRRHGKSGANLFQLYDQAINGLISFTNLPMRLSVFAGIFLAGASLFLAVLSVVAAIFFPQKGVPQGIVTLLVAVFFFSGIQLLFIGIIGEYVAATHAQVRQGFAVFEQELINFAPAADRRQDQGR
ncbi:MAG: glycosyltransferase family 2 protein [Candidatus Wallbacteria bacterium]|nr:glycosyltransferase family 2 protein [Candidatus Wallbacteria bacterium]